MRKTVFPADTTNPKNGIETHEVDFNRSLFGGISIDALSVEQRMNLPSRFGVPKHRLSDIDRGGILSENFLCSGEKIHPIHPLEGQRRVIRN